MPRIVDHDAKRAEILEDAHRLFVEHGYHEVSMRGLAKALGFSTGTLYHYFAGKELLFESLVRWRAAADVDEATGGLADDATPAERLARLAHFVAHHHVRLSETLLLVQEHERAHDQPSDFVRASLAAYRGPLVAALGEEAGNVGLSLILGMLVQRQLLGEAPDVRAHLRGLAHLRWIDRSPGDRPTSGASLPDAENSR